MTGLGWGFCFILCCIEGAFLFCVQDGRFGILAGLDGDESGVGLEWSLYLYQINDMKNFSNSIALFLA